MFPDLIPLIVISLFLLCGIYEIIVYNVNKKKRPEWEDTPKEGDKFVAECRTFYLSHSRILSKSFHPTKQSALEKAKKDAVWHDKYGNVHLDVGIMWEVNPL